MTQSAEHPQSSSDEDAARALLEVRINRKLEAVNGDYSLLVLPKEQAWLNTLLTTPDLDTLRKLKVSWQNHQIERLLGDHVTKMKQAGVMLAEGPHGFIIFRHITPK